jgi:hypothetical protein
MKIVFLDKDGTLGNFGPGGKGLYPRTSKFLKQQKRKKRKLYVVTFANAAGRAHLKGMPLDGYFGREKLDPTTIELYILPNGEIRNIRDDYERRETFETKETRNRLRQESLERADRMQAIRGDTAEKSRLQQEINDFFNYWRTLLHKETKKPFDEATRYQNPNDQLCFLKDLHLVRRLISPQGYDELNAVMVGDTLDESTVTSDPKTPLIVVSNRVRSGEWGLVEDVLDPMLSDGGTQAWERFEALYSTSRPVQEARCILSLNGVDYTMKKGEYGERIIHCP